MATIVSEDDFQFMQDNATAFAKHILDNKDAIHSILREYQSKEVIDDEIDRSINVLQNIHDVKSYFTGRVEKISVFIPLNLPLYSMVLFTIIPSYQSSKVIVRAPEKMTKVVFDIYKALSVEKFYKNISLYVGLRQNFIEQHCKTSNVVIFTGKYLNFIKVRESCSKDTLVLFNGVGHNPIVVTETADINLAVEKTLHVKLFNNGQDCAGPEMILVHSNVIDCFIRALVKKLDSIKIGFSYEGDDVRVGPLFEKSSLSHFSKIINDIMESGGEIIYGGEVDYKHNLIYPCVCKNILRNYVNYEELYSPIFIIAEYFNDDELDIYFNDANNEYIKGQMYVSVFGYSQYIGTKLHGTIPLLNASIHDVEYGNEEYGGYGVEASAVSYENIIISKPLLIPREIYTYLLSPYHKIFQNIPKKHNNPEIYIVENLFKENTSRIFSDNIIFAYIFGSYAINRAKSYSDIDTLICVKIKDKNQIREYLNWLFEMAEVFGKIPDFKYPAEIVEFEKLRDMTENFSNFTLSSDVNSSQKYDIMVWLHSLSHYKIGIINEENIPNNWESIFPMQSGRILKEFLADLRGKMLKGIRPNNFMYFNNFPMDDNEIENYIKNLGNGRKLINILKYISFKDNVLYNKNIVDIVGKRPFFGRKLIDSKIKKSIHNPMFRFGFVSDKFNEK